MMQDKEAMRQVAHSLPAKTLGEMTPAERTAAISRAAAKFQGELTASADAIGRIMSETAPATCCDNRIPYLLVGTAWDCPTCETTYANR